MTDRPTLLTPPTPPTPPADGPPLWFPTRAEEAPPTPPDAPAGRRAGRASRALALAAVAVLAGGTGAAVATALDDDAPVAAPAAASPAAAGRSATLAGEPLDVAGVVAAVGPSVVSIQAQGGGFGSSAAGTGVIISADGEILTNAHVVDGATSIRVTLAGESESREAELVGAAPENDLALLRVAGSGLPAADLGSSSALAVGDDVVAIGNALALRGGPSVTRGIVSALDRTLDTANGTMTGLVQTDASISSGNSGGPLVNAAGEVIGINTAVATGGAGRAAENIGFAIAIDQARPIVERLRTGAPAADPGFLGVNIADPDDGSRGAVVTAVTAGSPADAAGLAVGDLLTEVEGTAVDGAAALGAAIRAHAPGERITLTFRRDGAAREVEVTLGDRP